MGVCKYPGIEVVTHRDPAVSQTSLSHSNFDSNYFSLGFESSDFITEGWNI